jgi:hypothetical protein
MVQGTPCDLQNSENFKLTNFWNEKMATKDKTNLQQMILKINMDKLGGADRRETVAMKKEGVIGYEQNPERESRPTVTGNEVMHSFAQSNA